MRPLIGAVAIALAAACAAPVASTSPPDDTLRVFAAASLSAALDTAAAAYASSHVGVTVTQSNASPADLRTQIEQGAAADLFLSDDTANPQALADASLSKGAPVVFARGPSGVEYSGVVLSRSTDPELATDFLDWLRGADGQAILARFGLQAP